MIPPHSGSLNRSSTGGRSSGRPGTGNSGFGQVPGTAMGRGFGMSDIEVSGRPVTQQHGVAAVLRGGTGSGRQVFDVSYYISTLRGKISDLTSEISRFQKEVDEIQNNAKNFTQLERRYEEQLKTVRNLEGELADFNLALDKQRSNSSSGRPDHSQHEDVRKSYLALKGHNDQQRLEMDEIFLEKKHQEDAIESIKRQTEQLNILVQKRLESLSPDQRALLESCESEIDDLNNNIFRNKNSLEELRAELYQAESHLMGDNNKYRLFSMQEEVEKLKKKKLQLESDSADSLMTVGEQRDKMLAQVKKEKADIAQVEKIIEEKKEIMNKYNIQIKEISDSLEQKSGNDGDNQKMKLLMSKQKEIDQFLTTYDSSKKEQEEAVTKQQEYIMKLMQDMSTTLKRSSQLPTFEGFKEMEDDLDFKNKQLENSETTHGRLESEKFKRQQELSKIDNLEEKITSESDNLKKNMQEMKTAMIDTYDHINKLREDFEKNKIMLSQRKERLEIMKTPGEEQARLAQVALKDVEKQVNGNACHVELTNLAAKLKQHEQNIYNIKTYIKTKSDDTDCTLLKKAITETVSKVNTLLVKAS
eukprot:GHVL01000740.1.p1 GENE.GHVL01000740.1~~GHVL01000740.1.p1  ORF type:complete len:587 (+),score=145.85 GHVL01000740.1:21-1781(+)